MTLQAFINQYRGRYVDWDKNSGPQCVDLAKAWAANIGHTQIRGNAIAWKLGARDYRWIPNSISAVPNPGDIVVFNTGQYGHVAINVSANKINLTTFDQNWPTGSPCKLVTHYFYKGVLGWLRPL